MTPKNLKRKLRRSRRILNEMRNRISLSKRININLSNMKQSRILKSSHINENFMMLPNKMVRSETITRSVLHKSKQTTTNTSMKNNEYCYDKSIVDCDITDTYSNMSKCIELFSPLQASLVQKDDFDTHDTLENNIKSTSFFLSSETHELSENIYDSFINSLSKYILETAPVLLQTDIIDKKKLSLERILSEINKFGTSKRRNIGNVIHTFKNICSGTDVGFVKNSTDYKESAHQQKQVAHAGNVLSPAVCIPPVTMNVSLISEGSNVCDSPEYSYYPHRLNY